VKDFATARGLSVGIEIWSAEGDRLAAEVHSERLGGLVEPNAGWGVAFLATDQSQIKDFSDVAGPVVAWRP